MGDGVGVELLLEELLGGLHGGLLVLHLHAGGVFLEDGRAGEAEELGLGEELLDGAVILAELGPVAFVEDENDALVAQRFEQLLVGELVVLFALLVALAGFIQRETELLDGGDDDLVRVVLGEQPPDEGGGIGVFLDAALLEAVELLAGLAVEVLAVHDEEALLDVGVVLEQGGRLEGGERLAAAGGVPDEAVAAVLVDAIHDALHGIDLIRAHHHELLLALDEDHITADRLAQGAFDEESFGKTVEVGDLFVGLVGELVDGEEALVLVEGEVAGVIVGEIPGVGAVADDEKLDEAEERLGVAVAGVVLVLDDLLHGPARTDAEGLQLDLHAGHAVDEDENVVAVVAVVGVDAQLVDHLEGVFAPVFDVDQGVLEGCAVVALEGVALAHDAGGDEDVRGDDALQQSVKLVVREAHAVQGLEVLPEVALQRRAAPEVRAVGVFEVGQLFDQQAFDLALGHGQPPAFFDASSRPKRREASRHGGPEGRWSRRGRRPLGGPLGAPGARPLLPGEKRARGNLRPKNHLYDYSTGPRHLRWVPAGKKTFFWA
ncbi:MAG: hypothetical protein BWY88_00346 [Synergistetes bacterium ADurb.Bin520]|nr:MAG: hypothetical protein BWY88_00346 [Synergistetes bacterium ADurb.Bin520]